MKQKLSAAVLQETWEVVGAVFNMFWAHVDMPPYVQSVANDVMFAQFVEFPYQKIAMDFNFAFTMSALWLV